MNRNSRQGYLTNVRSLIAAGFVGGAIAAPSLLYPLNPFDGGLAPSAGVFLLHGALPYRDFWWLYGPLGPFVVAAATALFGPSLLAERLLGLLVIAWLSGIGYAWLAGRIPFALAVAIPASTLGLYAFYYGADVSTWSTSLAVALTGLYVRVSMPSRSLLAGVLIGLAFLIRLDLGGYALIAGCLAPGRTRFIAGAAIVAGPVALLAAATTPLGDLVEQLIWYPIVGPRQFRALPVLAVNDVYSLTAFLVAVLLPKGAAVLAGFRIVYSSWRPRGVVVLVVFAALCQLQTTGRGDIYHQVQAALPGTLLVGFMASGALGRPIGARTPRRRRIRLWASAFVGTACTMNALFAIQSVKLVESGPLPPGEVDVVAGIRTLAANTNRDEPVFVGLTDHRITFANDMLVYYLADRRSGVRVAMFNPGVTNTDRVQREMIEDLKASRTQLLFLDDHWARDLEPTNDSALLGSTILDEYLATSYIEVCRFGEIHVKATPERAASVLCAPRVEEPLIDILSGIRAAGS